MTRYPVPQPLSRRIFLALTCGALAAPSWAAEDVPPLLDHILLGCNDLQHGIDFVEKRIGVRAAFGGVHPGRGTQNALLSLAEPIALERNPRRYLEIIAPDPQQPGATDIYGLQKLSEPRLVNWAVHLDDIQALANRLAKEGIAAEGPTPGSRKRPDGRLLQWKALRLKDDASGLLPFFIEWGADSPHPSASAPRGCHLDHFEILTPDPDALAKTAKQLGIELIIVKGNRPQLRATIVGTGVEFVLTS
jgi:hypothetical protein